MLSPNAPSFLPAWAAPSSPWADVRSSSWLATCLWTWTCSSPSLFTFPVLFFSLLCWWYEWRKCLSPEGHQGPARHQLLSACKGLLQWWGFYLYYLSQMLRLALMPHLLLASAGQRRSGYKLLNADGRGGSRPPEMLQMTIPVTGKIKKTMSHTTPCLPHHCPPQWACRRGVGGTVWLLRPRDFPALTKWNLATSYWWYLCQVPHTRCVLLFRRHTRAHSWISRGEWS